MISSSAELARPDYSRAVNEALATLAIADFGTPRVSLSKLVGYMDGRVRIMSYRAAVEMGCPASALYGGARYAVGMSRAPDGRSVVLYNGDMPLGTVRFSVAHELGHILLRHRQNEENYGALEREADCFARNLLCPVTTEDYFGGFGGEPEVFARVFGVSLHMAKICAVYRESDYRYADRDLLRDLSRETEKRMDAYFDSLAARLPGSPPARGAERWLLDRAAEYAEENYRLDDL